MNPEDLLPLLEPLVVFLCLLGGAGISGWIVSARLRRNGLDFRVEDGELNWAGVLGLLTTIWVLLLGGLMVYNLQLPTAALGRLTGLLGGVTVGVVVMAGFAYLRRRALAEASREERAAVREQMQWLSYAAFGLAVLAVTGLSLSLPVVVLLIGIGLAWMYRNPASRKKLEEWFSSLSAGQQLRDQLKLRQGMLLGEFTLEGPIGLWSTLVRRGNRGELQAISNHTLLEMAGEAQASGAPQTLDSHQG